MLEPLSIQSIAKWFEEGCSQVTDSSSNVSTSSQSSEETSDASAVTTANVSSTTFPILECTDIYLLSKLFDVKSDTLLDRAQKQLQAIAELPQRKDRLLTISSELLGDGRRSVAFRLLNDEIEGRSPLFCRFPDELYFHRALIYLKDRQLPEALTDLFLALHLVDNTDISSNRSSSRRSLDPIHVHILEEIKKYLTTSDSKDSKQVIFVPNLGDVSFNQMQVLKQYDKFVNQFIEQHSQLFNSADEGSETRSEIDELELFKKWWPKIDQEDQNAILAEQSCSSSTLTEAPPSLCSTPEPKSPDTPKPTYKSMLMGEGKANMKKVAKVDRDKASEDDDEKEEKMSEQSSNQSKSHSTNNSHSLKSITTEEKKEKTKSPIVLQKQAFPYTEIKYTVQVGRPIKEILSVQQSLLGSKDQPNKHPPLVDNLFHMRALLVDNLAAGVQLSSLTQIFRTFGTVLNAQFVKANSKDAIGLAALVEFDNADSPRMAISCLSEVSLPHIGQGPKQWLQFRFARSERQRRMRICKENQVRSSRECYFWRTTGCRFAETGRQCKFYHHRLAKGVDKQDWMLGLDGK